MTTTEPFTVRPARAEEDAEIAALVVEGFLDKFQPVFGKRRDISNRIMEKWIQLEHSSGGVLSLVAASGDVIVGSVGVRMAESREDVMARGVWKILTRNLGFFRTLWATTLLSYPRYSWRSSEAYVERLVVSGIHRNRGIARKLLNEAESLGREADKMTVGLHVGGGNLPALSLYEAEGYEEVSRQRSFITGYFLDTREWLYLKKAL